MATKRLQVYKCGVCGNIVEVVHQSVGELACCSQSMNLLTENTTDAAQEKHVPVIERTTAGIKVKVGAVPHPMQDDHFIEWIEVVAGDRTLQQFLQPGQSPEAFFPIESGKVIAREYCNLHGHWKAE